MGTHPIFESDFDCLTEHVLNDKMCLFWRRRTAAAPDDPDYACIEQTIFTNEPIYQRVKPKLSTRTFDDPLPIPSKCSVNVALDEEDDNYAKIGLEESEGDDSVFGDSSDENNCYAKVVRPPAPPVRIQSIRSDASSIDLMHHYDPVYISTTDNKIKLANERQKKTTKTMRGLSLGNHRLLLMLTMLLFSD